MNKIKTWIKNYFLCKKYPFLRITNVWTKKKYGYSSTELDMLPKGWKKRFGIDICKELSETFKKSKIKHFDKKYMITQIKEKFGGLRWYDNGVPDDIFREYMDIINKYEDLSENTCIECGENAEIINVHGWSEPLCEKCLEKLKKREDD